MLNNNILILTNSIIGLYCFRKEVVKAIIDAGYTLYVTFPDKDQRAEYFESIGCKYVDVKFNRRGMNPIKDFKLLLDYIKVIKHIKPIAILTYTIKPNVYGGMAAAFCGVPLLANVTGLGDSIENKGLLSKLAISLYKMGLKRANTVFFQNLANLKFCINHGIIKQEQTHLLPGSGVNTLHHIYQEYPSKGVIKFLFIARLLKDKGTDEYFETAKMIKDKYPNTEFQILGYCEGNYQGQLDELAKKGIIKFLGETTDVRLFIKEAHCTIMPSYHEGLSNVNLESGANGRPIITTDVPGCKETVDDGITGYLCKPRSTKDLMEKVEKFINLPYEEKRGMGIAARKKAEREFDRRIVVDAYLRAIKEL